MRKSLLFIVLCLVFLLLTWTACASNPACEGTDATVSDWTQSEQEDVGVETEIETEGEIETASVYLIPDPTRIDLAALPDEVKSAAFAQTAAAYPEPCEEGVRFVGAGESLDPAVIWQISSMYEAAGYPASPDGRTHVPFTPEEKRVIVFKIRAEWGGAFELFYATENRTGAVVGYSLTEIYGGDSEHFGARTSQYVIFEADGSTRGWSVRFNDGFRLDYTNFLQRGDEFLLEKIAFCADRAEAEAFIAEDQGEPAPIPAVERGYYVCLYEDRLHIPEDNVKGAVFSSLADAIGRCNRVKQYGYRVANEKGEIVYTPYSLLQCNLLREGNYITGYARETGFKYGDSPTNPAVNHRPLRTSCDRLVDWILYRAGFTDQPLVQGKVVSNLEEWCKEQGFERITRMEDLQAGDVVFVRPSSQGYPLHVFMLASDYNGGRTLRYDHGSDARIVSPQPSAEPVTYDDAPFMFAYRPIATAQNNVYYGDIYEE